MSLRFSIGLGSLGEENLILLTGLKETLKPKREKIFRHFERDRRIKQQNYIIETWVRMIECYSKCYSIIFENASLWCFIIILSYLKSVLRKIHGVRIPNHDRVLRIIRYYIFMHNFVCWAQKYSWMCGSLFQHYREIKRKSITMNKLLIYNNLHNPRINFKIFECVNEI